MARYGEEKFGSALELLERKMPIEDTKFGGITIDGKTGSGERSFGARS